MIRYYSAAVALKLFSATPQARRLYGLMGQQRRALKTTAAPITGEYLFRTEHFLDMLRRHGILRDGLAVFELGTGWVHWESLVLRHEIACTTLLYDVVDKRDPARFAAILKALDDPEMRARLSLHGTDLLPILRAVEDGEPLERIYERLGFSYLLDPDGLLAPVPDAAFDLVVSTDVFEHLHRPDVPTILRRLVEVLKPGGFALHQAVLEDHLALYDASMHKKHYLGVDERHWNRFLQNRVQYINRMQLPDWREALARSGARMIEERVLSRCDIAGLRVDQTYAGIPAADLECTVVQFLVQRPPDGAAG